MTSRGISSPGGKLFGDMWLTGIDTFTHFLLPTISLTLISFAGYTRYARAGLLEVMNQDYIRTARSKGLGSLQVVLRHGLRNASIPVVTYVGTVLGALLEGVVITEFIFAWPGLGLQGQATGRLDYAWKGNRSGRLDLKVRGLSRAGLVLMAAGCCRRLSGP